MGRKKPLRGSKVFLTGGTGFLGRHFRRELDARNVDVTLLIRPGSTADVMEYESIRRGDIASGDGLDVSDADIVVHFAAQTSIETAIDAPRQTWDVNATGTQNLLEACRNEDIQFLLASTASVYGAPSFLPITEDHPMNVKEPYGASKAACDRLASAYGSTYGMDIVIARFFNVFGPGQPAHNVVPSIVSQAIDGGPVELGNLSPSRDFIYVKDAIRGALTVLESGKSGVAYNVGQGDDTSIKAIAETVCDAFEDELTVRSVASRERDQDVEIPRHVADVSRLNALGWSPEYTVEEGLQETVAAMRDEEAS